MKVVKKEMIQELKIKELGYDMMGYTFKNINQLSFHHLIVPKREHGAMTYQNGSILVQKTAHDYLHIIEQLDREIFDRITSQMIEEKLKRKIEREELEKIRDLLLYFEREHDHDKTKKGLLVVKREFVRQRIPLYEKERKNYYG